MASSPPRRSTSQSSHMHISIVLTLALLPAVWGFAPLGWMPAATGRAARSTASVPSLARPGRVPRQACTPPALRMQDEPLSQRKGSEEQGSGLLALNPAVQMILSRRSALGVAAAAGAATLLPKRSEAQTAIAPQADLVDAYGEGIRRAPGKLVVGPDGQVEKSPADKRSYRALTLPNGLRVLLASDPTTNKAAASLDVHVGHYSDPTDIAGMAHFCEHMLFLGTKRYPEEGYLEKFLSTHGGSSNAYTDTEDTNYHFDVNQGDLAQALDIFSGFFIAPLFTAAATGRELNAIESEHSKNLQTDSWRLNQVLKLRSNPKHPYYKFGTGNKYTLEVNPKQANINLREELLKFHDKYYSANQMTLAVVGREDLDTLQKMVVSQFSAVPNTDRPTPEVEWQGNIPVFEASAPGTIYKYIPVRDKRDIYVQWALPYENAEERTKRQLDKASFTISTMIGNEGKGSLLSYLKYEKNWVTSLGASTFENTRDLDVWGVIISLTKEGQKNKDKVIEAVFSYLNMIRETGIPTYVGDELVELSNIAWQFQDKIKPLDFATGVSAVMHQVDDPSIYIAGARYTKTDLAASKKFLDKLLPEQALVTFISKDLEKTDRTEIWYGASYGTEPVGERLAQWSNPSKIEALKVPEANPFIPKDLGLKGALTETEKDPIVPPAIILDDDRWRVHYKGDNRYGKPKAYAFVLFTMPSSIWGEDITPRTSALCKVFKRALTDALNEFTYPAFEAGLTYDISFTTKGPELTFNGYNDKLPDFVTSLVKTIAKFVPSDQAKFERYKDSVIRDTQGFVTDQPIRHAALYSRLYTTAPSYTPLDVLEELEKISLGDVQKFAKNLWKKAYGEALIQGNIEQNTALAIIQTIDQEIKFGALPEKEWAVPKLVKLPQVQSGYGSLLNRPEPNPENPNSAVQMKMQSFNRDIKEQVAWEVLTSMMDQAFYADLRTKQQLGYIVSCGIGEDYGVRTLTFSVQSSVADTSFITSRILTFIDDFGKQINDFSDDNFAALIQGSVRRKIEREKKLTSEVAGHWVEIQDRQYVYDRLYREASALKSLKKEDVIKVFEQSVAAGGPERRVLTTEIRSQVPDKSRAKGPLLAYPGLRVVPEDPKDFKTQNGYFSPLTNSETNILSYEPTRTA